LQGYDKYVLGAYVICGVVLALTVLTAIIAVVLRKDDTANVWLARWAAASVDNGCQATWLAMSRVLGSH